MSGKIVIFDDAQGKIEVSYDRDLKTMLHWITDGPKKLRACYTIEVSAPNNENFLKFTPNESDSNNN